MKFAIATLAVVLVLSATSWAQEDPSIEQLQAIFEYLETGTRPQIYQITTATGIEEKMPIGMTDTFGPEDRIYIWMRAAVPANIGIDDYYTVSIERELPNGNTQSMRSKPISFEGGSRGVISYRTWTYWSVKYFKKPGNFFLRVRYQGVVEFEQIITITD